jgi:RNA exonuclease 1
MPFNHRHLILSRIQEELARLSGNPQGTGPKLALTLRAMDLEENMAKEKVTAAGYKAAAGALLRGLKKKSPREYQDEQEEIRRKKNAPPPPAPIPTKGHGADNRQPPLSIGVQRREDEIRYLAPLVAKEGDRARYGYIDAVPSRDAIHEATLAVASAGWYERCDRCDSRFIADPARYCAGSSACQYHPGRRYRNGRGGQENWDCCNTAVGSNYGCQTSPKHVYKLNNPERLAGVLQFMETPPNRNRDEWREARCLAIDCEMGYTTHGMELLRLTAVAYPTGAVVIDALVKPVGEIIDYNSRFSGITAQMYRDAKPWAPEPYPVINGAPMINPTSLPARDLALFNSIEEARAALCEYIDPRVPLVGHALENDLKSLRLVHATVVDTCILFPHERGFPRRTALKWLVRERLGREIQEDVRGHDSAVDARCAGELVRWEVKRGL